MARTISQIYDAIIVEKESAAELATLDPSAGENAVDLLAELSSGSKVAIWRLLFWTTAVAIWIHEKLFDTFRDEIDAISLTLIPGTAVWYWNQCFLFQYGDDLVYNAYGKYVYDPVDAAAQIIKRAAVVETVDNTVKIKVAKLTAGVPAALSAPELAAFEYYIGLIKFAGTNVDVISADADQVKTEISILYDPLILSSTGELIATPGTYPVENAVNDYLAELPFDGTLIPSALTDAIQAATGVLNAVITDIQAKPTGGVYAAVEPVSGYVSNAGYMKIDVAFPLNTSITYVADEL